MKLKTVPEMLQGSAKAMPMTSISSSSRIWDPGKESEYVMFKGVNIRVKHDLVFHRCMCKEVTRTGAGMRVRVQVVLATD